ACAPLHGGRDGSSRKGPQRLAGRTALRPALGAHEGGAEGTARRRPGHFDRCARSRRRPSRTPVGGYSCATGAAGGRPRPGVTAGAGPPRAPCAAGRGWAGERGGRPSLGQARRRRGARYRRGLPRPEPDPSSGRDHRPASGPLCGRGVPRGRLGGRDHRALRTAAGRRRERGPHMSAAQENVLGDLEAALRDADLPSLLPALAHVTGDLSILRDELRPAVISRPLGVEPQGGLSERAQKEARQVAADTLRRWLARGRPSPRTPSEGELRQMMEFITGPVDDEYLPLLRHQLGLDSEDAAPAWHKSAVAPDRRFRVVIIGAGMSGLAAAHHLRGAGIPFVVLERNDEVGGVWWENHYPGCRLDTSNYSYSYSFAQRPVWPHQYSTRESILDYFRTFAAEQGLRESIRLGTRVLSAAFDEPGGCWRLRVLNRDGRIETLESEAVISA